MIFCRWFCLIAWMMALPAMCSAWWEDGHIIVAKIAEAYLTPEARAGIKDLLSENRDGERAISDKIICTWADEIRRSAELRKKYPKNDTWHYINIELKVNREDFKPDEQKNDVVGAIERFKKAMTDPKLDKQLRKEAMMFVVHFLGDMHQPMHTGNRENDQGGNLQPVKSVEVCGKVLLMDKLGNKHNLHKVWDGHILDSMKADVTSDDFAKRLIDEITQADRDQWQKGSVVDWVWDSHAVCVARVYKFSDGSELPKPDAPPVELTEENYIKANKPFVREQLKKGGVRLAMVLNECFAEKK